jgi:hypothetical protein
MAGEGGGVLTPWSETEKKMSLSTLAWLVTGTSYGSSDAGSAVAG